MNATDRIAGETVQNYVRRKWQLPERWTGLRPPSCELDKRLQERIDLLGVDDRQLIEIEPEHVMARLKDLEVAAELEDSGLFRK